MSKNNYRPILKTRDYLVSSEEFVLFHDPLTDMLITKPVPASIEKYYNSASYISHQDANKSLIDKIYYIVKSYTLGQKVKLISKYTNGPEKLLDIGAGTGDFLNKAKTKNWRVTGVEPNIAALTKAIKKNIKVLPSINELLDEKYQVITLWHVLEHIPNLEEEIYKIERLLDKNGSLIVAVPNYKSYDARYYQEHWAAYDVPRHLWHFSQKAIATLFEKINLNVIETIPMKFDSFYVSLLSEKYKTGNNNYLNSLYRGLLSNLKARHTGEYSSLIYVLQRDKT